eukprot:7007816-Prymnesium_polylepis.1
MPVHCAPPYGTWHPRSDRPRARPALAGCALELSGCETAASIDCDAPMAAELACFVELPDR